MEHTVDGQNPAPVVRLKMLQFMVQWKAHAPKTPFPCLTFQKWRDNIGFTLFTVNINICDKCMIRGGYVIIISYIDIFIYIYIRIRIYIICVCIVARRHPSPLSYLEGC